VFREPRLAWLSFLPGKYLPGPNARLQRTRQDAAEDVAEVRRDDRFYAPDAPGRE
jgi:hypothetical protein